MQNLDISEVSICGVWVDDNSVAHVLGRGEDGAYSVKTYPFKPFLWLSPDAPDDPLFDSVKNLDCGGIENPELTKIAVFKDAGDYAKYLKLRPKYLPTEKIANLENQFLMQNRARMHKNMRFSELRRMQLDIETSSECGFSDPERDGDRVIAVGIKFGEKNLLLEIGEMTDDAERKLLSDVQNAVLDLDPDTIEGHNIFRFDLEFIRKRLKKLNMKMLWGRFGGECSSRNSRIKIAERIFDYPRCDIPGRTVVDTFIMLQLYDISAREMDSYSLKAASIHFGFSKKEERTYIAGDKIQDFFFSDRETFRKYLLDDIRETRELANRLLPSYFAQAGNFPLTLQECILRGSGMKVEYVFLEKYLHANAALPPIPTAQNFVSGGFSESFKTGVFKNVLHYDVASLYPSLMLAISKCPKSDYLKIFLDVLRELRAYRLEYKKLAKTSKNPEEKNEFNARQASFKILINSFYGYLGLATARFGDAALADEITTKGRELLAGLIENFTREGCEILEADTDGIYISCGDYFSHPQDLLPKAAAHLPQGVELEFDGAYKSMFCYKAKNYALLAGDGVLLKGSALRSRSMEGFLRKLTWDFINIELGASDEKIEDLLSSVRKKIESGAMDISELAKSEYISASVEAYKKSIQDTGKGRRASMEAACKLENPPRAGDKVSYFISNAELKKGADWKRAYPVEMYDAKTLPYDPDYYLKKLDDWREKFAEFLPPQEPVQGELF
ncbi:MAG: DNA polymerase [Opitutales bacterium]|nr:DNA polymerase [Opitutales bacterium]